MAELMEESFNSRLFKLLTAPRHQFSFNFTVIQLFQFMLSDESLKPRLQGSMGFLYINFHNQHKQR